MNKIIGMSEQEREEELEKCKNSISYFYNNYCRKEGMPEYTEEVFNQYKKMAEEARFQIGYFRRGKAMLKMEYPLNPNECFPNKTK